MADTRENDAAFAALHKLKDHLREQEEKFHWTSGWNGDTESGFYSKEEFDFGALLDEIDAFAATFASQSAPSDKKK